MTIIEFDLVLRQVLVHRASPPTQDEGGALASESDGAGWSRALADAAGLTDEQATARDLLEEVLAVSVEKSMRAPELGAGAHDGVMGMLAQSDTDAALEAWKAVGDRLVWKGLENLPLPFSTGTSTERSQEQERALENPPGLPQDAHSGAPSRTGSASTRDQPVLSNTPRPSSADTGVERPHVSAHPGAIRSHAAPHDELTRPTHGHHAHRTTHDRPAQLWMTGSGVAGGDDAGAATVAGVTGTAARHGSAVGDFMLPATRRSSNQIGVPLLPQPGEIVYPASARLIARATLAALKRPRSERDADAAGRDAFALPRSPARAGRWLRRVTHAYLGRDGLTLWVRDASFTDAKTGPLVAALHQWARAAGMKLGAVICNGRTVFRAAGTSVAQGQTEFATEGER
ncbi:hypothetical protein [Paraburkholderia ferrariae]|uniref:Uncharacterized protein n=1 Tax=Paraburkholderia ferrariae TaxID=386056 RepID=A0ABU9RME5_9BURK